MGGMFRRSGSAVVYFVEGKLPAPGSEELGAALATQRFRTIETAASEEVSLGWVTAGDPTGDSFDAEDLELDPGQWLRVRIDKKKLPTAWLAIHRSVAERSAGRPLSARERRDLKEDLCEQLLPRTLPSVQFLDALWLPKSQRILLFTTSTGACEEFEKLFFRTFAVTLVRATPHALAIRAGLGREQTSYLDEVSPIAWPRDGETGVREAPRPLPLETVEEAEAEEPIEPETEPQPVEAPADEPSTTAEDEPDSPTPDQPAPIELEAE